MPERTIDVLNGDGSTRTITIPDRSKYAGVRTISKNDGSTLTVNRTAPVVTSDRAGESRPLLSKVVGKAAVAYSLRDLNDKAGSSKVVRVRRSADNREEDFTAKKVKKVADWVNGKQETTLPADVASAAAAYSLRKVRSAYTSNVLRVRRAEDNVEVNVAFDANDEVSTSSPITNVSDEPASSLSIGTAWSQVAGAAGYFASTPLTVGGTYATPFKARVSLGETVVSGSTVNLAGSVSSITGSNWVIYPAQSDNSIAVSSGTSITSTGVFVTSFTLTADAQYVIIENTSGTENITLSGAVTGSKSAGDTAATTLGAFISEASSPPDIHIVTWYDQSGNSNDATQSTLVSQPKIVDYGTLLDGGLKFDGANDFLITSSSILSGEEFVVSSVQSLTSTSGVGNDAIWGQYTSGTAGRTLISADLSSNDYEFFSHGTNGIVLNSSTVSTDKKLLTVSSDGTTANLFRDGALADTDSNVEVSIQDIGFAIGAVSDGTFPYNGSIEEIIVFNSDQSNNRFKIESNINNHYGIYTAAEEGFVSTWYDQSGREKHSVQDDDITRQPKIVDATDGYLEEVDFDGTQYFEKILMADGVLSDIQNTHAVWIGQRRNNSSGYVCMASSAGGDAPRLYYRYGTVTVGNPTLSLNIQAVNGVDTLCSVTGESGTYNSYVNGVDTNSTGVTASTGARDFSIGASVTGFGTLDGTIKEFVLYDTDEAHNRRAIEANIANQYGITLTS